MLLRFVVIGMFCIIFGSYTNGEHLLRRIKRSSKSYTDNYRPYFDTTETNVTVQQGTTAYLRCRVKQLGNRIVSWIRQSDLHILAVGTYTYTDDQRFTSIHRKSSAIWTLEIKRTQKKDIDVYECHVSSEPVISLNISLNVVAHKAHIAEGPSLYVKGGSTISLTCLISESALPLDYVLWYHDDRMLNHESGVKIATDSGLTTISRLRIENASSADSGNYSCRPSNADIDSITVHVLNDGTAELEHGISASVANSLNLYLTSFFLFAFLFSVLKITVFVTLR